jgi:hypothetical protein
MRAGFLSSWRGEAAFQRDLLPSCGTGLPAAASPSLLPAAAGGQWSSRGEKGKKAGKRREREEAGK